MSLAQSGPFLETNPRSTRLAQKQYPITGSMRVTSQVGNLPSKFGHARPLGSRIICYVRDGRTDGRTKATLSAPLPCGRAHNKLLT